MKWSDKKNCDTRIYHLALYGYNNVSGKEKSTPSKNPWSFSGF